MTTIDISLYAHGALRLARHGYGRGGNVLVHVPTGDQCEISDGIAAAVDKTMTAWAAERADFDAFSYFDQVRNWHGIEAPVRTSRY